MSMASPGMDITSIYGELRRPARTYLAQEAPGHTLQGTALVHEMYLRLARQDPIEWRTRREV